MHSHCHNYFEIQIEKCMEIRPINLYLIVGTSYELVHYQLEPLDSSYLTQYSPFYQSDHMRRTQ